MKETNTIKKTILRYYGDMKRFALTLIIALCMCAGAYAQTFFNLTAQEVKIDSVLPTFTHQVQLGANYNDSVYEVSIDYPEFIDMTPTDIARYERITDEQLPEMPAISQHVAVSRKVGLLEIAFVPLVMRDEHYQKLVSFKLTVKARAKTVAAARKASASAATDRYAAHSVMSSGKWVKISVPESGVYQLTNSLLSQAGFSDPSKVKVYGYGGAVQPEALTEEFLIATDDLKEVPTCEVNGRRLFYAEGPVGWENEGSKARKRNNYSTVACYFLTDIGDAPQTLDATAFQNKYYPSPYYYHSLAEPEEFAWYHGGRNLYTNTPLSLSSTFSYELESASETGSVTVVMTYDGYCAADVLLNDVVVGSIVVNASTVAGGVNYFGEKSTYSSVASDSWSFKVNNLKVGKNTITLQKTTGMLTKMRLDYVLLTMSSAKDFGDLSATAYPEPAIVGAVANQDLHADANIDMVIIVPNSNKLTTQAERLKTLHEEKDGLTVKIVSADQLYNEFSSGTPDANAYRRYMKMLYDRASSESEMPKYLLLFGDCAWDNRMLCSEWKGMDPNDFLLCYESENSFSKVNCFVSDDFFCMLDDGERIDNYLGKPDVAVGRIPARTEAEARVVVDKICGYRNNDYAGDWQNMMCFLGDDGDSNQHMEAADQVATLVENTDPAFNIKKVYWDAYTRTSSATGNSFPDVRRLLLQQMNEGALLFDYNGHGSNYCLSHEMVLELADFEEATTMHLPLWITASCDIMPFDTQLDNIGEKALLNSKGGAIAFFGTSRTVFLERNLYINLAVMKHMLTIEDGKRISMAEAIRRGKCDLVDAKSGGDRSVNKLNYNFLGDPALALAAPTMKATVESINGIAVDKDSRIQLKSGSHVTVKGKIEGQESFNGVVTIVVRDVEETVTCKMNSTSEAMTYKDRPNTIYNGSDSVSNGQFTISFAVPRDISYSADAGQMLVYAVSNDKTQSAHGVEEGFSLNGTEESDDSEKGPSIYCYLNSRSFVNGGTVNSTPYFYAELQDADGINGSGSGIGHNMELIIDGDLSKTYILNSYFQYSFGDFTSGTVGFSIPKLTEGKHKLLMRAWDILNNSSTAELDFVVDPTLEPEMMNIVCIQDASKSSTRFMISHDRIGSEVDVALEVFDTSGRILWRKTETVVPKESTLTVDWDYTVDSGSRLQSGLYLYRVLLSSSGSTAASAARKMIVSGKK